MIGLDTNLLVRLAVLDDRRQAASAKQVIDRLTESRPGYINIVVMAELAWVLTRRYRFPKEELAKVISRLLQSVDLQIEREPLVTEALDMFQSSQAEFADILINLINRDAGCETTMTFDKRQRGLPTATVLT